MELSPPAMFDVMSATPTSQGWTASQVEAIELALGLCLPQAYVRLLRFAGPCIDYDSWCWDMENPVLALQSIKSEGWAYQFHPSDFILDELYGSQATFFRTDRRDSNPPVLHINNSSGEMSVVYPTIELYVLSLVRSMMSRP